ncbi:MAG: 4Fe-4S dicluster domain-containing protein [Methanotrichaceae archaeon]|nr:4Fe-4S dicluster domain-containing protein [Methanotrichaceae archaeon]
MIVFLAKDKLPALLSELNEMLEVVAPVRIGNDTAFATWVGQPIDFEKNPQISPTEFLLPQREVLFKYIQHSGRYVFEEVEPKSKLILGMRPCDLNAVKVLDKIFGTEPFDKLYFRRRRSAILAVLNCSKPEETCFCSHLGAGPECIDGFDLLFTELDSGYLIESGSSVGMLILKEHSDLFQEVKSVYLAEKNERISKAKETLNSRPNLSKDKIMGALETADWESMGNNCLSCGGCTFVCPICHCFNILDLGVPDGERLRCRDSCILSGFSRMAGGVNPRKSAGERIRNWYFDKFQFIPENTGLLGCVGCGRCISVCLASMDRWSLKVPR